MDLSPIQKSARGLHRCSRPQIPQIHFQIAVPERLRRDFADKSVVKEGGQTAKQNTRTHEMGPNIFSFTNCALRSQEFSDSYASQRGLSGSRRAASRPDFNAGKLSGSTNQPSP